ncbi:MAG: molecular chaperone DnaJ, partial [Aquificota bacterium]
EGKGYRGEMEKVVCHACEGTGKRVSGIFNFPRPCSVCKGRGYIIKNLCPTCGGRGRVAKRSRVKVNIPPGTDEGEVLKVSGFGHTGERGGESGDLYLRIGIKPHEVFKKVGKDLYMEKFISFPMAVLGGTIKVKWLDGRDIEVFVQPGTECGSTKTLLGHGFPAAGGAGNLVITFRIEVPKDIGSNLRSLLERLARELRDEGVDVKVGLVDRLKNLLPL